jgi:hypothetical protein
MGSGALSGLTGITSSAAEINGTITLENNETISNAVDGTILLTGATQSTGNVTIGNDTDATDYAITFDGNASNMVATWMEDESELTLLDSANEGLNIDFNTANDNEVEIKSGTDKGVTRLSFSSLNMVTTGTMLGAINVVSKDANYTIGTDYANEAYGTMFINSDNDTQTLTLPSAVAGMSLCVMNGQGVTAALTLDAGASDYIVLDGARTTVAAEYIVSSGAAGDFVCVFAADATDWYVMGKAGTWTEEVE